MKHIIKRNTPKQLTQWLDDQKSKNIGCSYEHDFQDPVKAVIKKYLLEDQGYLCCYTGIRISESDSHFEHFKPQSKCEDNEDVDYRNLFAAFPKDGNCPFGAHARKNHYDERLFINPLDSQCEKAFQFDLSGKIHPILKGNSNEEVSPAEYTIEILKLNEPSLVQLRLEAIEALLFESDMSLKQAKDLLEKTHERTPKGKSRPFCFVLKLACEEYIRRKEKAQTRNKGIQSQEKTKRSKK
jgi:uncharacterized protein (TIGR02646 family)